MRFKCSLLVLTRNAFYFPFVVFYVISFCDRQENSINQSGVEGLEENDRTSISIPPEDEGYAPGEVQRDERLITVR